MSKGLKVTLLTVAVALMGMFHAMAEAPVMSEIPTVIIGGGASTSTPPDVFVYPDALDLSSYVSDDGGDANLVWSYDIVGTQLYSFNGVDPIGANDTVNPGSFAMNTQVLQSEVDPDSDADTVTLRNIRLSPFGGGGEAPDAPGALFDSQVVTMYVSDGDTVTMGEVMVWTENQGPDRLSIEGDVVLNLSFVNDNHNWGQSTLAVGAGAGVTMSTTANGICVEVAEDGVNIGTWSSGYGVIDLSANSVYALRMTVNSNQDTPFLGPLWDVIVDNFSDDATAGANAFFQDNLYLDNENGANAAAAPSASFGRNDFEMWYTPASVITPQWNDSSTGAFTSGTDADNDLRIQFRILDGDVNSGYGGELDLGQVCLEELIVTRYPYATMTEGATVFSESSLSAANTSGANVLPADGSVFGDTSFDYTGGNLSVGPAGADWLTQLINIAPGDGDFSSNADDFPITWEQDQLYLLELEVSAADADDESSPADAVELGFDTPTNELIALNAWTRGGDPLNKVATPKQTSTVGGTQTYVCLFNSHSVTDSSESTFAKIRPRIQIICSTDLSFVGETDNTGGMVIHSWTVKKVSF
jgi:hypothetical protein